MDKWVEFFAAGLLILPGTLGLGLHSMLAFVLSTFALLMVLIVTTLISADLRDAREGRNPRGGDSDPRG